MMGVSELDVEESSKPVERWLADPLAGDQHVWDHRDASVWLRKYVRGAPVALSSFKILFEEVANII